MRYLALVFICSVVTLIAAQSPVRAALIVVGTFDDVVADDGVCSLREAIANANDDAMTHDDCNGGSGADQLLLDVGTYELAGAPLELLTDIELIGSGMDETIIDAGGLSGVFELDGEWEFEIRDLTITGGSAPYGAGILHEGAGKLSMSKVRMTDNHATQDGFVSGGAIRSEGALIVRGGHFRREQRLRWGGNRLDRRRDARSRGFNLPRQCLGVPGRRDLCGRLGCDRD